MLQSLYKDLKSMAETALQKLMAMTRKKVIVTGGSGFVGSYVMRELGDRGINLDLRIGRDLFTSLELVAKESEAIIHLAIDPLNIEANKDLEKTQKVLE